MLGAVMEVVTGKTFDVVLKERIFGPLGMKDTDFYLAPEQVAGRVAQANGGNHVRSDSRRRPMMYGTNGPASTTNDYLFALHDDDRRRRCAQRGAHPRARDTE